MDTAAPPRGVLDRARPEAPEDLRRRADWVRLRTIERIARAGLGLDGATLLERYGLTAPGVAEQVRRPLAPERQGGVR